MGAGGEAGGEASVEGRYGEKAAIADWRAIELIVAHTELTG